MNKKQLMKNLKYQTYCRLGVSKIQGVGVIAITDIKKGVNPFNMTGDKCPNYRVVTFTEEEVEKLPQHVIKLVKDFISPTDGLYQIPLKGFNSIDITFYLNHSKNNNLDIVESNCVYLEFVTNRLIKQGEELTINYDNYM